MLVGRLLTSTSRIKLANTKEDAKRIRCAEARVEKALKSSASKKAFKQSPDPS